MEQLRDYDSGYWEALDDVLALLQTIPTEDFENAEKLRLHIYKLVFKLRPDYTKNIIKREIDDKIVKKILDHYDGKVRKVISQPSKGGPNLWGEVPTNTGPVSEEADGAGS